MRITHADLHLWSQYRAPMWARPLIALKTFSSIHEAINGHVRAAHDNRHHAMNTCTLLRSMRRRYGLRPALHQLATTISPPADPRRAVRCRRWLIQLERRTGRIA